MQLKITKLSENKHKIRRLSLKDMGGGGSGRFGVLVDYTRRQRSKYPARSQADVKYCDQPRPANICIYYVLMHEYCPRIGRKGGLVINPRNE